METLIFEKRDNIGIVTLNRPERYNAINEQMLSELISVLEELEQDKTIRALILTGAGQAFCAGGDFGYGDDEDKLAFASAGNPMVLYDGYRSMVPKLVFGLQNLSIPTIAAINGFAVGMGCDTALACDIRIACEHTKMASIWIKRGLIPAECGFWLLPRIVGIGKAAELIFSGRFVEAEEGERIGLFNKVVPASNLIAEAINMAQSFIQNPSIALKIAKMVMYSGLSMDLHSGMELAGACQALLSTTEDFKEAMDAWREKRPPVFKGR